MFGAQPPPNCLCTPFSNATGTVLGFSYFITKYRPTKWTSTHETNIFVQKCENFEIFWIIDFYLYNMYTCKRFLSAFGLLFAHWFISMNQIAISWLQDSLVGCVGPSKSGLITTIWIFLMYFWAQSMQFFTLDASICAGSDGTRPDHTRKTTSL